MSEAKARPETSKTLWENSEECKQWFAHSKIKNPATVGFLILASTMTIAYPALTLPC